MTYHKKSTWEWTGRGYFGEWRAEGLLTWLELRKEINQIWPSSHHDSSLVILFSRSHSRKPCRLWTSSGRHMACAIMTHTGTRLCDYLVCWTHKTLHQSHRLLPTLGRTHGKAQEFEKLLPINHKGGTASMSHTPVQYWLFIYQSVKCAWSQDLLGQSLLPAKYENVKILSFCHWSLLSCYVLTSDPIPKYLAFKHLSNILSTPFLHYRGKSEDVIVPLSMSCSWLVDPALLAGIKRCVRKFVTVYMDSDNENVNKLRCYIVVIYALK